MTETFWKDISDRYSKEDWVKMHHTMIFFGRYHCTARAPKCVDCPLLSMCQDGKVRMRELEQKKL